MKFKKITEEPSLYRHLDKMTTQDILLNINKEDEKISAAVRKVIPAIEVLVEIIAEKIAGGGRLFYVGAGTSGRLGVLDASECPPTYGVPPTMVIGIMAGGDDALRNGIEDIEDDERKGWDDLLEYNPTKQDVVIGIAASGTTPYVIGALSEARKKDITTGSIVCNLNSPVSQHADYPIEVIVGPEFVTGSTRMKSGTAQKLILNMISTSVMIRLGLVQDNRMVNMQISNAKLVDRGVRMLIEKSGIADYKKAKETLLQYGSVRSALENLNRPL
jgi:N-acetylmuramic acid 6-phosphate etherase